MNTLATGFPRFPLAAALALVATAAAAVAQDDGQAQARLGTTGPAELHHVPARADLPMPPQALRPVLPGHTMPELAEGTSTLPQPDNPPGGDAMPDVIAAPGDLRYFTNRSVRPRNTSTNAPEPSAALARDTAFMTANWFGGLSKDSGRTFELINPYTRFGSVDGGFCCDQRTIHVPNPGITVWYLQYVYSASTAKGSVRIAVAVGRDGLRNDQWHSWVFSPRNFGQSSGTWLDFPDIAYTNAYLYATSNVFDANNSYVTSVLWRMSLTNLRDGGVLSFRYFTRNSLGASGSYRFAQGAGARIYFASHVNTSSLRVYRWPDGTDTVSWNTRSVPSWRNGTRNANAPNGVNWIGRHDSRVQTGYFTTSEYGFLWSCEENGGSRPFPFIRAARFRVSDNTLIDTEDIWNGSYGLGYPGMATNSRGDKGVVLATGGPSRHVRSVAFMVDSFHPDFHSQDWVSMNSPSASPPNVRWGDYFTVQRHPYSSQTFVGTGAYMSGSTAYTRFTWFGREQDQPTYIDLTVQSTPIAGVPITIDVLDRSGRSSGSTTLTRTYNPRQGYELTAPSTRTSGSTVYVFDRWALRVSPSGTLVDRAEGVRTLTVSDIGNADDLALARYAARRTLTVRSINPDSGVTIAASPRDLGGRTSGSTTFTLLYKNGTDVTLTAPDLGSASPFRHWTVNGVPRNAGNRTLQLAAGSDLDIAARYDTYVQGSYAVYGTGCPGTGNFIPLHGGTGVPDIGTTAVWEVRHAAANLAGAMYWGTQRIPGLPLQFLGMGTCTLDVNVQASIPIALDGNGFVRLNLPVPNLTHLIGGTVGSQAALVDPGAQTPVRIVHSNPLGTTIGGVR